MTVDLAGFRRFGIRLDYPQRGYSGCRGPGRLEALPGVLGLLLFRPRILPTLFLLRIRFRLRGDRDVQRLLLRLPADVDGVDRLVCPDDFDVAEFKKGSFSQAVGYSKLAGFKCKQCKKMLRLLY